jgi:hypothetical protein
MDGLANRFTDHLQVKSTSNYSAVINLHISQITLFQPAMSSAAVPQQQLLTVEILQLQALISLLSTKYCAIELLSTVTQPVLNSLTNQLLHFTSLHFNSFN